MGRLSSIRRPKVYIPLGIVAAALVLLVIVIKNMSAPAVGTISQPPQTEAAKADPYTQPGRYSGKYVAFNYPPHFKTIPSRLSGSALEIVDLHTTDISGKQIAIEVRPGSTSASGDVQYRRQNKNLYTENDSQKWVEFTKNDGTEDSFFIEHSGMITSVSATSPNGGLNGESLYVASSLKWLK